jgi:hypothetical protein
VELGYIENRCKTNDNNLIIVQLFSGLRGADFGGEDIRQYAFRRRLGLFDAHSEKIQGDDLM